MNFAMIGSIGQYTRNMKLTMDWEQKQDTKEYTKKSDETTSEWDIYRDQMEQIRQDAAENKSAIYTKLSTGKKLTAEELDYLKEHDPEAYRKAKEIEAEQKSYEEKLKHCRTKEETERTRMNYLAQKAAMAKAVANNPNIPKGQKMAILLQENAKMKAVREADTKFRRSLQYASLPTEEELTQEKEERMAELRGEPEREEAAERAREQEEIQEELTSETTPEAAKAETDWETVEETGQKEAVRTDARQGRTDRHRDTVPEEKTGNKIHWIDLRQTAKRPKPRAEHVRQLYQREMEFGNEPEKKNRIRRLS